MKKSLIFLLFILQAWGCLAQSIDTSALQLLQKSYDKLLAMPDLNYRMTKVDTMFRANQFQVNWVTIQGMVKKGKYWHLRFEDDSEWLLNADTLYKKDANPNKPLTFTTDWDRHKMEAVSIYNLLGTKRPDADERIASLQFVKQLSTGAFYVIDKVYKNIANATDEIEHRLKFDRYFIHKESLFTFRRMQYGKRLEKGKEAVDIYDFTASIEANQTEFNPKSFFDSQPQKESDRFATLKTGSLAPPFTAIDLRTGKAVGLKDLKGKVVLMDFWYLSCMPCRELMPKLQQIQEKFNNEHVVVIGINVRDTAPKEINQFLKAKNITYDQYYKAGQLLAWDYKLQAFPTTLIIGADGRVKLMEVGMGEGTPLRLEQAIINELQRKGK